MAVILGPSIQTNSGLFRSYFKNSILVLNRGGAECQTGGIHQYFEDLTRSTNKEFEPKDIFEIASILLYGTHPV
jgi:hypothetical protein